MKDYEITIMKTNIKSQLAGEYVAPLMLLGMPGVGKTSKIRQLSQECKCGLVNMSGSGITTESLSGIPSFIEDATFDKYYSNKTKQASMTTQWSVPELLVLANTEAEREDSNGCVLLLDDIHTMSRSVLPYLYELLLERKLGTYKLHPKVAILMTANDSEEADFAGFPSPVVNRIAFLHTKFDFNTWYKDIGINYHMYVSSFLKHYPNHLQEDESTDNPYGTPRSYDFLSNTIKSLDTDFVSKYSQEISKQYISKEASIALAKHIKYIEAINFSKIVKDKRIESMSDKAPLDIILWSYLTHYIDSVADGEYFISLMEHNVDSSIFIGFSAGTLAAALNNREAGIQVSPGLSFVLDRLIDEGNHQGKKDFNPQTKKRIMSTISDYLN